MDLLRFLILLGILCFIGYQVYLHVYLAFWHPQEYAKFKEREHELKIAKLSAQRAEQNQKTANVASGLARVLLTAVFKRH